MSQNVFQNQFVCYAELELMGGVGLCQFSCPESCFTGRVVLRVIPQLLPIFGLPILINLTMARLKHKHKRTQFVSWSSTP